VADGIEKLIGTNPRVADTDGDGISDKWEYDYGLNPSSSTDKDNDSDNDGLSNYEEYLTNSIPNNPSSPQYIYIDADVTNEGDGTLSNPYKTITYALNNNTPPYIFRIKGLFKENLTLRSDFIFIGENKSTAIIEAKLLTVPAVKIESCNLAVFKNITFSKGKQVVYIDKSNVKFSNCIIKNSSATVSSGGGIYSSGSNLDVINTDIYDNTVTLNGAGIYMTKTVLYMYNSTVKNNSASYDGGGVFADTQCSLKIMNSRFFNNYAGHYGAGLTAKNQSPFEIANTVFAFNSAVYSGGAVYGYGSIPKIESCVFYKNTRTSGQGSNLFLVSTSSATIKHTIFWGDDTSETQEDFYGVNASYISYCNIEDRGETYNSNNNISTNPILADPDNYNFHLQENSPCINAGAVTTGYPVDIDGDPRPYENNVDIGVDEFIPVHGGR